MSNKKWCYNCTHYYTETTCGYTSSNCHIVGSLDIDQCKYQPWTTADTCKYYNEKKGKLYQGE